ncbi:MAG: tRNA (adenosine(37)-N6)-dimethylallyltransferase MiaA [Candidatus Dormibacteria bacterium]
MESSNSVELPQVLAIMGPTASGKTELAVALAHELGGELVNADSRQAIAELNVGVCKPTAAELQGVVCHGLDWRELGQPFSVATFRKLAAATLGEIAGRDQLAIVVGGTGLYIRALLGGFDFGKVAPDRETTATSGRLPLTGASSAQNVLELQILDADRADQIDLKNPRRVNRALELVRAGARAQQSPPAWSTIKLACRVGPVELRDRIEVRSEKLMADPLRLEVARLEAEGFSRELLSRSAIGYAEVVDWSLGRCGRHDAVQRVTARTWRYAKAQLTWLRSEPGLEWVNAESSQPEMVSRALSVIHSGPAKRK